MRENSVANGGRNQTEKQWMGSEGTRNENNRTKEKPSPPAVF
jgi:hypothetical protein